LQPILMWYLITIIKLQL